MDKVRRDRLRSVICAARVSVEEGLATALSRFGLYLVGSPDAFSELRNLTPEEIAIYPRLIAAVRRHGRAVGTTGEASPDSLNPAAVKRFVRESGATWVNRLAALRALEARGFLTPPAARLSPDYGDLSARAYHAQADAAAVGRRMPPLEAMRVGLTSAFREMASEVAVLFDLDDEASLVWPKDTKLKEVLTAFSTQVDEADWAEPDVLGWVYQYYQTVTNKELKRRKKVETGFKLTADDVPVANQFYTPNWVVRALADNTIGRLWLERTGRLPRHEPQGAGVRLVDPRVGTPNAAADLSGFASWASEAPDVSRDVTVDRLCRFVAPLPSTPPAPKPKDLREFRVLDPACGSGHFLLYAFDVLVAMWREAEPSLPLRDIPALVLEHNLFGIDIDLRAAQLAAFALYLKARTVLAALDSTATLEIRRLNIVVAEAHLDDDTQKNGLLRKFNAEPETRRSWRRSSPISTTPTCSAACCRSARSSTRS